MAKEEIRERMRFKGDIIEYDKPPEEAEAVKRLRLEMGLSHDAMAKCLGISKRTLINWENPETSIRINVAKSPAAGMFWGLLDQYMTEGIWPIPFDELQMRRNA